jgi:hypothetical protein
MLFWRLCEDAKKYNSGVIKLNKGRYDLEVKKMSRILLRQKYDRIIEKLRYNYRTEKVLFICKKID